MIADDAENLLEVVGIGGSHSEYSVGLAGDCVRLYNFRDGGHHVTHPIWRHPALAIDLNKRLDGPAECGGLNAGRETPDNAT